MTDAPQMRWLRLWTDVIDDPKLLLLAPDDRWYYVAILACKRTGLLDEPDSADTRDRKVALRLRLDHRERDELRRRLMDVRLIDENWQPCGWDNRQFASDSSAERTRQWRERHRNVTVTPQIQNRDRSDTEQKKNKNGASAPTVEGLHLESWAKWSTYRKGIGKAIKVPSIAAAQKRLASYGENQAAVVEHSIANGYQGLYAPTGSPREPPPRTWRPDPNNPEDNGPC